MKKIFWWGGGTLAALVGLGILGSTQAPVAPKADSVLAPTSTPTNTAPPSAAPTSSTTPTPRASPAPTVVPAVVPAVPRVVPRVVVAAAPRAAVATPRATAAKPAPAPAVTGAYYANCTAARAAGVAPILRGHPGYRPALDRDNDGIACETT